MNQIESLLNDQDKELLIAFEESYEELARAILSTEDYELDMFLFLVGVPDVDWIK